MHLVQGQVMTDATGSTGPGRPRKIDRLIEEYGLDGIGDELEAKWTAEGEERRSLRDLAAEFNRRLLAAALADAGVSTVDGEEENLHRLLTDGDVSPADRTRARRRLERDGVDVEGLEADFVSYQAIRTYLQDGREASFEADEDPLAGAGETVARLRNRFVSVTESKLAAAERSEDFALGDHDLVVDARVVCSDCGFRADVASLFDRGGCDCA